MITTQPTPKRIGSLVSLAVAAGLLLTAAIVGFALTYQHPTLHRNVHGLPLVSQAPDASVVNGVLVPSEISGASGSRLLVFENHDSSPQTFELPIATTFLEDFSGGAGASIARTSSTDILVTLPAGARATAMASIVVSPGGEILSVGGGPPDHVMGMVRATSSAAPLPAAGGPG